MVNGMLLNSPLYWALLLAFLGRLLEFARSRHNTTGLRAAGGIEAGAAHYPLFFVLHGAWFAAMFVLLAPDVAANWWWLGAYAGLQVLRLWTISSLGPNYSTRVIVVPDAHLVRRGPYRFCKHPIYALAVLELAILPLAFGAWKIAAIFTLLNLALLALRIRVENAALAGLR
jgi:methyltransferase